MKFVPGGYAPAFLDMTMPDLSDARCNDPSVDPDWFFPDNTAQTVDLLPMVRQICGMCTESAKCLQFALDNHITEGIWAGLTGHERQRIANRKERNIDQFDAVRTVNELIHRGWTTEDACDYIGIKPTYYERAKYRLAKQQRESHK